MKTKINKQTKYSNINQILEINKNISEIKGFLAYRLIKL